MTTLTRPPLSRLTLVELRKLSDTRAGFWLLAATALLTVGVAVIAALVLEGEDQSLLNILAVTVQPASILMPVAGILLVTSEWSQRTAMTTFALVPDRGRVLGAKALAGAAVALAAFALSIVVALVVAVVFDATSMSLSVALIGQALFSVVVPMVIGVAFGAVLLASAPAIVLYFVLPTAWAALGSIQALHDAARWLDQARSMTPLLEEPLSGTQWARVGTSLALWLVLPMAIGAYRVIRSDPPMTREGFQGFLALVGLTQGLLPLGLKLFGADSGPIWCVPARLDGSAGWVVAVAALLMSTVAVLVIEERA